MKFQDFDQFAARHPELAKVIEDNPKNPFIQDMRDVIESGRDLTKNMRNALDQFRPSKVTFSKGDTVYLPVTLTGKPDDKGVRWKCPELRLQGRFTWDIYEETFPAVIRQRVARGEECTKLLVDVTVEWVAPDGGFTIGAATHVDNYFTKEPGEYRKASARAIEEIMSNDAWRKDSESWERAETSVSKGATRATAHGSKPKNVAGVYYYRTLAFKEGASNKFWNVAVEKVVTPGHEATYRLVRNWGRIDSEGRGQSSTDAKSNLAGALGAADRLVSEKLQKGYRIANVEECFGMFDGDLDFAELRSEAEDRYVSGAWYDAVGRGIVTRHGRVKFGDAPQIDIDEEVERAFFDADEEEPEPLIPPSNARQAMLPTFANWKDAF